MIVLDTNVVSGFMKNRFDEVLAAWLDSQTDEIWTTAVTVHEVRFGLNVHPDGQKRRRWEEQFRLMIDVKLKGRVLPLDAKAATQSAAILAKARGLGRPVDLRDIFIAGVVAARPDAVLATRNTRHFADAGISLVDPWQDV